MTKSREDWTHEDFIKDGMVQVFDVTRCRHYYRLNNTPLCRKVEISKELDEKYKLSGGISNSKNRLATLRSQ